MSIKLLVSDVDGTLVDKDKKVAPATVDAVRRLKAAGLGFTIISARPRSGMMPIAAVPRPNQPPGLPSRILLMFAAMSRTSATCPAIGMKPVTTWPPTLDQLLLSLKSPANTPSKKEPTPSSFAGAAGGAGGVGRGVGTGSVRLRRLDG